MPRRREVPKRNILPDPKFGSQEVSKFVNVLMTGGKKSVAETIVYGAVDRITEKTGRDAEKSIELLAQRTNGAPLARDRRHVCFETGELVDQQQVRRGVEQRLVLMLSVELDQPAGQVAQGHRGGQRAVDERPAPALDRYLASND